MKTIGFICDTRTNHPPKSTHSAVIDRVVPMAAALAEAGVELFLYSPHHVDARSGMATGYRLENKTFEKVSRPVPVVNGTWFYNCFQRENSERGMSMVQLREWAGRHGCEIVPSAGFSRLVSDKYSSYEAIAKIDDGLHPPTQIYLHEEKQLATLLDKQAVFIKPRHGGHGNEIFVIEQNSASYSLRFYKEGIRWSATAQSLRTAVASIKAMSGQSSYVIQPAIKTRRYGYHTFDIRMTIIPAADGWKSFSMLRLGRTGSDVSNLGQGGTIHEPREILEKMYSSEHARSIFGKILDLSVNIGNRFMQQYANSIPELALDYILDENDKPWLVEMNIQPGMVFPGMPRTEMFYSTYENIFAMTDQERAAYDRYTGPYGVCLAEYFLGRLNETSL